MMNWQEWDIVVVDSGGDCKRCVRAGFKIIRKMKCENESKNDYFCTSKGMVQFFKNDHFLVHFHLHFSKMVQK